MKEDRCGCHWSGVIYPVNLKRKALIKNFFLVAVFMYCEGKKKKKRKKKKKFSGRLKLEAKILQKGAF